MSHCYSVGVQINGKETEVCTVVPGNEDIEKEIHAGRKPQITNEHIDRAVQHYLKHKHEEDEKVRTNPSRKKRPGTLLRGED